MKKNKVVGILVALGGMLISFGAAIALYTKTAAPLNVNIGPYTWHGAEGDIEYSVGEPVVSPTVEAVGLADANGYSYSGNVLKNETAAFALGGSYASSTNIKHNIIAGKVTVTINIATDFIGHVKAAVYMNGYDDNSDGQRWYASTNITGNNNQNVTLNAAQSVFDRELVVENDGSQKVNVYLDFSEIYTTSYLPLTDAANAYSVDVAWEPISDTNSSLHPSNLPVIRGDYNNWEVGEEYGMLPDISKTENNSKTRYVGRVGGLNQSALTGNTYFAEFKVYFQDTDTWVGDNGNNKTNTGGAKSLVYIDDGDAYYL